MGIEKFDQMVAAAVEAGPVPVAVAAAHDPAVLKAVDRAQREGIVRATLVGDWPAIEAYAAQTGTDLTGMTVIHEADTRLAARQVVLMARDGETGAVVKGQIKTADLLVQVLNREVGIRGHGLLTHVGIFELPGMDRLIYLSDSGVVVYPDVYQKLEIIKNAVAVARLFGLAEPKVAILAASDTVHPKIPASIDALALSKMADQGWVEGALVDGPLGLELAISPRAAVVEESDSPIAGMADILIVPNVEAGNIVAKGLLYFAHARMAGLVVGARVPVVISSRADSAETRYLSLAMAALLANRPAMGQGLAGGQHS
ncbi:MAG: bifunctional enoyl-CoA hydratase/phosphate acetyltransferase [Anaerolineae bacterium]|jgi:phosphate butyryltransferase|nr:bifunctional enoyl-CoA hydratase/phosphate acetyltransferase [Anaerolineae bacterium]MDX9829723.1 bifunctional enoyl-CoA hydratase/phosphate acetyltransferase [Anaerolineae bacterium]